jgi:hypothetical protein
MLPKVRTNAQGCSTCKIVLQTKKSAKKVLSAIGKGLFSASIDVKFNGNAVLFLPIFAGLFINFYSHFIS